MTDLRHIFMRWAGPAHYEYPSVERKMLDEPHRILVDLGDSIGVVRQCSCALCAKDERFAGAEELDLDWLVEMLARVASDGSEYLIVLTEEMTAPMADGRETAALGAAIALGKKIGGAGIACRLVVDRQTSAYPEGTWLRAISDRDDSMNDVLLVGMVGKVVVTEWSHITCTPGISTMVVIEGRGEPYGHAWEALVPLDEQPSPEQLEISRQLCVDAAAQFQLRYAWRGYVQVGKEVLPEAKVRFDIAAQLKKLPELWRAGRVTDYTGNAKRLAKLLRALGSHPEGAALTAAAESIQKMLRTEPQQDVLDGIASWLDEHPVAGAEGRS